MPRAQKLKVFRTPIGFHDAYVAAPSQKAALEAWGSDADLFARGVAERVEDPELAREPLEHPGEVIRRLRGTEAEQIAALPKPQKPAVGKQAEAKPKPAKPSVKPKPRPDRTALAEAEDRLAEMNARHKADERVLAQREADLVRDRSETDRRHQAEKSKLEREVEAARMKYERAMRNWRG
ncbi:MAG: hypothetical protein J7493_00125 [Porphyrobacter sp.]|nr:hypothetical protein [Porphyrobacter sp.]